MMKFLLAIHWATAITCLAGTGLPPAFRIRLPGKTEHVSTVESDAMIYVMGRKVEGKWKSERQSKSSLRTWEGEMVGSYVNGVLDVQVTQVRKDFLVRWKDIPGPHKVLTEKFRWMGKPNTAKTRMQFRRTRVYSRYKSLLVRRGKQEWRDHKPWNIKPGYDPWKGKSSYGLIVRGALKNAFFDGQYVMAVGKGHSRTSNQLALLDKHMKALESSLTDTKLELARQQLTTLKAEWATLRKVPGIRITFKKRPSDAVLKKLEEQDTEFEEYKKLRMTATEKFTAAKDMRFKLQNEFSAKVLTTMFSSFVSWSGIIPTSGTDVLVDHSLTTKIGGLPLSVVSWMADAKKDAAILDNRTRALAQLEVYVKYWGDAQQACTDKCAELKTELNKPSNVELRKLAQAVAESLR